MAQPPQVVRPPTRLFKHPAADLGVEPHVVVVNAIGALTEQLGKAELLLA